MRFTPIELDDPPIPNSSAGQHQHRCGALSARVAAVAIHDDAQT
jgi:hypothetical protein